MQFILAVMKLREVWTALRRTRFRTCQGAVCKSRQASGQACSCFCRYGCEGRIKHRNEFVSCWILAPLLATGLPASPGSHVTCVCVCVCVCVCGWFSSRCQPGRFSWRTTFLQVVRSVSFLPWTSTVCMECLLGLVTCDGHW